MTKKKVAKKEAVKKVAKKKVVAKKVTVQIRSATESEKKSIQAVIDDLNKDKIEPVDVVACERELRKYVRRDGGYVKGVTGNEQKRAQELLKLLGRKGLTWDDSIISVPQRNIMV